MRNKIRLATTLSLLLLAACGEVREFQINETLVRTWDYTSPWDDFPEVMMGLQKIDRLPIGLFQTTVNFHPAGLPFPGEKREAIACYYTRGGEKDVHIRPLHDSTYQGCLGHEFAHRWVDLYGLDDNCKEKDLHHCAAWKEKNWELQKEICFLSWAYKDVKHCNVLFQVRPVFVDGPPAKKE